MYINHSHLKISLNKYLTTVFALMIVLMFSHTISAQTCQPSNLYGWASQNGGTTGGEGGAEVVVTTMADLNLQAGKPQSLVIYVQDSLHGVANIGSNKTIYGLPGAKIQGSVNIAGAKNVIVRNLIIRGDTCLSYESCKTGLDGVHVTDSSNNIWLDHLDIADGQDGNCDFNAGSDFATVSWCKFSYTYVKLHNFSNLVGSDDSLSYDVGRENITYHHNWWADRISERQPRVRYGKIHVANNLYTSLVSSYLVGPGWLSNVLVEGNITTMNATPIKTYLGYTAALGRNNAGPKGAAANAVNLGTVFVPPYSMTIDDPTPNLEAVLRQCAGATLSDPRITSGVKNGTWTDQIVVSPQPFQNELKIEVPSGCTYKLFDTQGRLIFEKEESRVIETSSLPAGIYILSISKDGKVKKMKLQKSY